MRRNILGVDNYLPFFSTRGGRKPAVHIFFIKILAFAFLFAAIGFWVMPIFPMTATMELVRFGVLLGLVVIALFLFAL